MSFVDLATLTLHRRNELEARLTIFNEKCDRAIEDINKLKTKSQDFVLQLNCEPSELKERFLTCMRQLDEYMYLITDFNLAIFKIEETSQIEYTPVHDIPKPILPSTSPGTLNLIDVLSEPAASTSAACSNFCPPEKPKRVKAPKSDQTLIVFSSSSSSEEAMTKEKIVEAKEVRKEGECELEDELKNVKIQDPPSPLSADGINLPPQTVLECDQVYEATIMHVDAAFFWVITDDPDEVQALMIDMTKYYSRNHKSLSLTEVTKLGCCAFYDEATDCYYRGLFLKIIESEDNAAEIYAVDTGEIRLVPVEFVQPLYARFCEKPPYARCCYLAGVDLNYQNKNLMAKQEEFMRGYIGKQCNIEVDDNTSESLGVYVLFPSGKTLNSIIVQRNLALPIDKPAGEPVPETDQPQHGPPPDDDTDEDRLSISECPEYRDPVEAVTGYSNRDEADICKHYKGGPEKTCFKGNKCTKKHILKHPDGWTLDRLEVIGKCKSVPLPAPDTWHKVLVTYVCHYDRVYVHLLADKDNDIVKEEPPPRFGVVMPATTLAALVHDMNSPATRIAYKPLTVTPALGEIVAALYPPDGNWYRARVMSVTRADQSVEIRTERHIFDVILEAMTSRTVPAFFTAMYVYTSVLLTVAGEQAAHLMVMYVDYGTVLWVKEDQLRCLEARHMALAAQAVRCLLAGVRARSRHSQQWACAKRALAGLVQDKRLHAHVVGRDYDEVTVELFDDEGYSIAEQLAALNMVVLVPYNVVDDSTVTNRMVVP